MIKRCAFVFCFYSLMAFSSSVAQQDSAVQNETTPQHTNALAVETSPYLLLHAHNPVHWYGWNEQSLALAKSQNKPIFLSIGYSSCHWCHVMERESFMDEEIAKYLNDHFVCVKVDREERPDVDAIYMESLRVVNPRMNGGWPLSMFLTPDAKPFFGGTYFPARDGDRGARFGFFTIAKRVQEAWSNKQAKIEEDANFVANRVKQRLSGQNIATDAKVKSDWIQKGLSRLQATYDSEFGGFGFAPHDPQRPKFPEPSNLLLLLDEIKTNPTNKSAKKQLESTCERMMMGGIWDHLGGGFHRYSVDRFWKIPHFEKMLYDNAQLATVYSELYQITKREDFRMVVEALLEFVLREMQDKQGAFYSALDAESEGEEGKFYRWDLNEIKNTLSSDEFEWLAKIYGLNRGPNFESKYYVPQLEKSFASHAKQSNVDVKSLLDKLAPLREKLLKVRSKRPRPLTDTKVLASWNGMMIRGFADAGRILNNERYVNEAKRAADFVLNQMVTKDGRLFRTYTDGQAKLNAYLPDYADMIDGLIAIHKTTGEKKWLAAAEQLQSVQDELFWDSTNGGYFYTSKDHESLLARAKKSNDGPVPAGNSVAAGNLIYLAGALNRTEFLKKATRTALSASVLVEQFPSAAPRMLIHARRLANE